MIPEVMRAVDATRRRLGPRGQLWARKGRSAGQKLARMLHGRRTSPPGGTRSNGRSVLASAFSAKLEEINRLRGDAATNHRLSCYRGGGGLVAGDMCPWRCWKTRLSSRVG